jgi:hypothetical protein
MSYAFGGYTIYLPRDHLQPLDISVEDAMRLAITAGLTPRAIDSKSSRARPVACWQCRLTHSARCSSHKPAPRRVAARRRRMGPGGPPRRGTARAHADAVRWRARLR